MVYSRVYGLLQHILCHSSWPPVLAELLASGSGSLSSRIVPFPGSWTCKTGVILWKQTTESPMLKILSLHYDRHAPVQELTKCYWHITFGSNAFAGNHHSLLRGLPRKHKKLLKLYGLGKSVIHDRKSSLTRSRSLVNHVVESKREQILPSSTIPPPGISLIRKFVEHTVGSLRTWTCSESPLAEGKARVRWRCVSGL